MKNKSRNWFIAQWGGRTYESKYLGGFGFLRVCNLTITIIPRIWNHQIGKPRIHYNAGCLVIRCWIFILIWWKNAK